MNPITINRLHFANDSLCKHLISDCHLIDSGSCLTCSKQCFKLCSRINNIIHSPTRFSL